MPNLRRARILGSERFECDYRSYFIIEDRDSENLDEFNGSFDEIRSFFTIKELDSRILDGLDGSLHELRSDLSIEQQVSGIPGRK